MSAARRKSDLDLLCLVSLGLVLGTFFCYWQVRQFKFISTDDPVYVYENPAVQHGLTWTGALWAFKSIYASNWHPLTWLSHMLDADLYGPQPGGHHFTNLLFHLANTLLLFFVLRRMTGALWRSAFVAALFAWHPLHVESVAWVAERKDVLSMFFLMLTLLAYTRYVEEFRKRGARTRRWYVLTVVAFALGLMSKPMLVTTPFLLALLDFWPLKRFAAADAEPGKTKVVNRTINRKHCVVEKLPFLALAVAECVVTFWVQDKAGSVMSTEAMPLLLRLENVLVTYAIYLSKLFWPTNLALFYPYPKSIPAWEIAIAAVVLAGVTLLAIRQARKNPWLPVGWFWFLGTLVPVIGLVQVGIQSRADRYTYIPHIGLAIVVAWGAPALQGGWRHAKTVLATLGGLALLGCLLLTRIQVSYWRDSMTLFDHAVETIPGNYAAHVNLGSCFAAQGDTDAAAAHFKTALELNPSDEHAHFNLGCLYNTQGKLDEAVHEFKESLLTAPAADKYDQLGRVYIRQHKLEDGLTMFQKALALNPKYGPAHYSLGMGYLLKDKTPEAIEQFKIAVLLDPNDRESRSKLIDALAGQPDPAVVHYHELEHSNAP